MKKQEFIKKAKNYSSQKEMAEGVGYLVSWVKKELKIHGLRSKEVFKSKEKKIVNTRNTEGTCGSLRTNRKIYLDKFIELYNQGLNWTDIAKELNSSESAICSYGKELGLAVWFMDDGTFDHRSISICTNCFINIDIDNIISILRNNFNLHFSKYSNNIIRLTISDFEHFKTLIRPYIHSSLLYKIGEFKTPLNGGSPIKDNPVLNP